MKKIEAIIPAFKLGDVKKELKKIDVRDLLVTEMKEMAFDARHREFCRGAVAFLGYRLSIKIETICTAAAVPAVRDTVVRVARGDRGHPTLLTVSDIERVLDL